MEKSEGFPPIAAPDARILILGSLPGQRSIAEQQYYAHPQNAFWRIMRDVFGIEGDYQSRCESLTHHGVALWDVLHSSVRPGSMDADIRMQSATPNDFAGFFTRHPSVERVLCNGQKAGQMFTRLVVPELDQSLPVQIMPSTSPAFASMSYDAKLQKWGDALSV
jgi:hypoxanthine-DNA glycosylase